MQTLHFSQLPKPYSAYPKIIRGLFNKKSKSAELPALEYVVDELRVDAQHLADYKAVTGFAQNDTVPALYLAVLSQSLQMHMMSQAQFPFAVLGLVHIRNQLTQYRAIQHNETLQLSCCFGSTAAHEKGTCFDFITNVKVGDETVMHSVTTYLARGRGQAAAEKPPHTEPDYHVKQQWQIEENIGRRYARVSGDFNLIHLHALSAKAFGFKRAIAHGMWSKARVLAQLHLPERYEVDVWFKLPILLPAVVDLCVAETADQTEFLVRDHQQHKPHLVGSLQAL